MADVWLATKDVQVYWWNHPYITENLKSEENPEGEILRWKPEWLQRLEWLNLWYGSPQAYIFHLRTKLGKW